MFPLIKTRRALVACAVVPLLASGACSSADSDSSASDGLPATLTLTSVKDLTGPAGYAGLLTRKGGDIAVQEINDSGYLGETKVELQVEDTQSKNQEAAILATKAVRSKSPVLLGPLLSSACLVMSPIVQNGKLPTIYTQASAPGINIGKYIYRATVPGDQLVSKLGPFLDNRGVKSIGLIYDTDVPTDAEFAENTVPRFAKKYGMDIVASKGVLTSNNDFTAIASELARKQPDAVGIMVAGAQHVTIVKQLREAGYEGQFFGQIGAGGGNLKPLGKLADGFVWGSDFNVEMSGPGTENFKKLWEEKYPGEVPTNFAAQGYDQVWFAVRAIKEANSTDREKVLQGLEKVAADGFDGAVGRVTFKDRDEQVEGVIVEWRDGKEVIVEE